MSTPRPKKSLGQHFLSDPSILARIVETAGIGEGDRVLEIGSGPGGLTRALVVTGAKVTALETDPRMVEHLHNAGLGVELLLQDAMKADFEELARDAGGKFKLVANLPYNLSGPLTARLLKARAAFSSMTLMYQLEVANRFCAPPGTKQRGRLSVMAQTFSDVRLAFKVPPGAFRPPPKVESAVVRFDFKPEAETALKDEGLMWKIVAMGFQQRRKQLRNSLSAYLKERPEVLETAGLNGSERPETLTVKNWVDLTNALT